MIRGLAILLFCQWLGEVVKTALGLPLPGAVLGMLILLLALFALGGPDDGLQKTSNQLIQYLALLFLPPAVGLFFLGPTFADQWLAMAGAIVLGTTLTLLFCGALLRWLTRSPPQ
ncbi:MAG TPA: CidA/LrgA family protein [Spongiibacteraceae bacterium]|jgi:holin-like protein|nr:CidA/LrgA family protein [Spongiibacteraceae bacterium]HUH36714.1 CidA/LrgA family protein [Spongiibacteraceae bacterium]